ncbi:hypothetical protein BE18_04130 [Sorangium cellulosum]|uniref:HTH araC/xylS-type domain-containing protein n=1 Tax=Sorangium cellulosum TaxID=56 RepID=A0A150S8Y1_SORCE|nr:hypothetical protein BE18_04130 [Sorangium cellulosum]
MHAGATGSIMLVRMLVGAARAGGVEVTDVLDRFGCTQAALAEIDGRAPHELLITLWQEVPRRLGDDAFGVRLAQRHRAGDFDLMDYALLNAPDLGGCVRRLLRYQRLLHDAAGVRLELGERDASVVHLLPTPDRADALRHLSEWGLALILSYGQRLVGALSPVEVAFVHAAPADTTAHERCFAAPLRFHAARTELRFDRAELERPAAGGDPELGRLLDRHASEQLTRLPTSATIVDQVRRQITESLQDGPPEASTVARRLGLSQRSFFRRLKEHGTNFQALVEQVRRTLALKHMRDPRLSLTEIAFLLGYSEVSAFHRAFRRWTGESPGAHRRAPGPRAG